MKIRLDQALVKRGLVTTRSQAESYIKLGDVKVNGRAIIKSGYQVGEADNIKLDAKEQYVSRAGLKLASVAEALGLDFKDKIVLDVGSSTGGFTDYALQHGARKVIAVEVGKDQLHPSLRNDARIELHERTDIRDLGRLSTRPDIVLADVSFVSLRELLPRITELAGREASLVMMVKPQFEAAGSHLKHKGVIKNNSMRREILKAFELWVRQTGLVIMDKADSRIAGAKGNRERFYLLRKT